MSDIHNKSLALRELAELLDKAEIRFTQLPDSDVLRTSFGCDHYRDEDGDKCITIYLTVQPDEHLIVADIPWAYRLEDARDKAAARKAMLFVNYAIKAVHFGVDPDDGNEVRARAELWLRGVTPSAEFIEASIHRLARQFDYAARLLRPVWRGGKRELKALVERQMRPTEVAASRQGRSSSPSSPSGDAQ